MKARTLRYGRLCAEMMILLALFTGGMLAAYSFPDAWVEDNVSSACAILEEESNMEGGYATYFWHSAYGIADNPTDTTIYRGLLRGDRSLTDAAMRTDYLHYWHGYAVLLRPLSVFLSLIHIRYLCMMGLMLLLIACCWQTRARLGTKAAILFALGLLMSFILIAPFCLQYVDVYALALLGCLAVLGRWEGLRGRLEELFVLLGSLVCFFDFLTFPVLALGYPLLCCLLLRLREGDASAKSLWALTIRLSVAWMAGYALTWCGKAVIGSLLTGRDVIGDVLRQVAFRTVGDFDTGAYVIEITPWEAIRFNLESFFHSGNAVCFAGILLWLGIGALRRPAPRAHWARGLPLLFVALYPFFWYCALQNHSRVHFWMTYRILAVTVFGAGAFLLQGTRRDARPRAPRGDGLGSDGRFLRD